MALQGRTVIPTIITMFKVLFNSKDKILALQGRIVIPTINRLNTMFKVLFNSKDKIFALQGRIVIPTIITMFKALLTYVNIIDSLDMQSYAMSQAGMGFLQAPSGRIRNSSPSAFGLGQGIPNPALGRLQKSPNVVGSQWDKCFNFLALFGNPSTLRP